jgi:cytochrome b6-f complex iron-sulfur subunit
MNDVGEQSCPIDNAGKKSLTRREFLSRAWWSAAGLLLIETAGASLVSLWPKLKEGTFGSRARLITVDDARAMPVGTITYFLDQRLYISKVEKHGILALYRKCPHLGCVVPWQPDEPSEDNLAAKGRFNCPCHSSIFDRYGLVHAGPSPRPLDVFPIKIDGEDVVVDTGKIIQRQDYDESQVTEV